MTTSSSAGGRTHDHRRRDVTKRFGDFAALDDVSLEVARRLADRAARAQRLGQVDAAARSSPGSSCPTRGTVGSTGSDATHVPPQQRGIGFVFQHYAAFKHMTVRDNVALRAEDPQAPQGRDRRARRRAAGRSSGWPATRPLPVAALGRPAPAHGAGPRAGRRAAACCCSTSRSARWTPRSARSCATWLRRLHDEVHVTTVLVTHDQEEAMESPTASRCMNDGRIEQVGAPRELYDAPGERVRHGLPRAGQPARRAARAPARPRVRAEPRDGARRGAGRRACVHLGFEVRVELRSPTASDVSAQLTRDEADAARARARATSCWRAAPDRRAACRRSRA